MAREHDRQSFFKYTTVETALKIIQSHSLLWSSPLKFNDPFDHQIGFSFDFGGSALSQRILEEFDRIVFGDDVELQQPTRFSELAMVLRSIRTRLDRDEIMREMSEAAREIAGNFDDHVSQLHANTERQLTHSRVLCVSEHHDNVVMWSHYGDSHRGVVLELNCVDEIDNSLLAAGPVKYCRDFPPFPSVDRYVRELTGEEPLDYAALAKSIAFTKHADWSYEREWRVHMPLLDEADGDGYSLFKEAPQVFGAIYLGCRTPRADAERIIKAARRNLPHIQILRGEKRRRSFGLHFEPV